MELQLFNIHISINKYRYYCSLCKRYVRHFNISGTDSPVWGKYNTIGGNIRYDRCPYCNSIGRERLTQLFIKHGGKCKGKKILHVAPEDSLRKWLERKDNCTYIAIDKKDGYYENRYDDKVLNADITNLYFENESFDIIICNHVLEHVFDDSIAIRELYRVLKKGGFAIVQVPLAVNLEKTIESTIQMTEKDRFNLFGHKDHRRLYGQDYITKLENEGFLVNPTSLDDKFNYTKNGIDSKEKLIVCYK